MSDKKKKANKNKIGIRGFGLVCGVVSCIMGINTAANATTMCMTSDSTSIILDPSVDGTNYTSSAANATWSVTFPDYTVSGIASCNSLSGTFGTASPEYNNQITAGYQDGQSNCWCRMMGPVRSAWVFYRTFSSASECASECADYCGYFVRGNANVRGGVFGSAGN